MNLIDILPLTRSLIMFDCETTGPAPAVDRIVELGFIWFKPTGEVVEWNRFINPGMPIPHEATYGNPNTDYTGHGITDEMVKDAPTFAELAPGLLRGFKDCDYGGYNIRTFDLPLMQAEFARAGHQWSWEGAFLVDAYRLWQLIEARTLSDAVERFLKRKHEGAHHAVDDVRVSVELTRAQLLEVPSLPRDLALLHEKCYPVDPNAIDPEGKLIWKDGVATMNFGKKWKGKTLQQMSRRDLAWIGSPACEGMSKQVQQICRDAAQGRFPQLTLKEVVE